MKAKLTKRVVDGLPTPMRTREIAWDTEQRGFGCRVTPSGHKAFVFQYRVGGRSRQVVIGPYGALTVEEGRERAKKLIGDVASGIDPAARKAATRQAHRDRLGAPTVAELATAFLDHCQARCKPATVQEYERIFQHDILPALGTRRVADVETRHVSAFHLAMRDRRYSANRGLARLKSFFAWAEQMGERPRHSNPCAGVDLYPESAKERFLSVEEFQRLGHALRVAETTGLPAPPSLRKGPSNPATAKHRPKSTGKPIPARPYAVAAIRFLSLSGWRKSEALQLRWTELDLERGLATLGDTKTGRSVRPLGAAAIAHLKELPRIADSAFVFPGLRAGAHLRELKRVWYAVRHAAKLDDVRLHDLRHSFASVAADEGMGLQLIGSLLGHARPETTKRYAHLTEDARVTAAGVVSARIARQLQPGQTSPVRLHIS